MSNEYAPDTRAPEAEPVDGTAEIQDLKLCTPVDPSLEYRLPGEQVEPEASYWARCPVLSTVTRDEVRAHIGTVYCYPEPGSTEEKNELAEIRHLQLVAHDETYFNLHYRPNLSAFLQEERYIRRPPEGVVLNQRCRIQSVTPQHKGGEFNPCGSLEDRRPGLPIIKWGAELASLFENETPGLWHQHVLNVILNSPSDPTNPSSPLLRQKLSPPRQSLIWHALYTAIDSALDAVWHYKWLATGLNRVARRHRPWEADPNPILFDYEVTYNPDGDILRNTVLKSGPNPTPGTPRHPAYGSGHSTYSAAASYVLACLLPKYYARDFELLATNIGEARIWGGVHWRTDHEFGQQIGFTVGRRVIAQLNRSGISPRPTSHSMPPDRTALEREAVAYASRCGTNANDFCATDWESIESIQGLAG